MPLFPSCARTREGLLLCVRPRVFRGYADGILWYRILFRGASSPEVETDRVSEDPR